MTGDNNDGTPSVSIESGLEGRNNRPPPPASGVSSGTVSIESGLEGRNNQRGNSGSLLGMP